MGLRRAPFAFTEHGALMAALALKHDVLAGNTRAQFKQVIETLRGLMATPEPAGRPIGFVYL